MARASADPFGGFFTAFPALLGRAATAAERSAFGRYADLLLLWNRTHHLTSLRSRGEIGRGLFLDSLLFSALLPRGPLRVVDFGAGAGIPGVPLRVVEPRLSLTLIESRRKPVSFLHALVRELDLRDIAVHHGRAESIIMEVSELEGVFDFVVTRAVGVDRSLIEAAMRYLKPGGRLVASGPPAGKTAPDIGWRGPVEWKTVTFPRLGIERVFLTVIKEG